MAAKRKPLQLAEVMKLTSERASMVGGKAEVSNNRDKKERITRVYDNWPIYYLKKSNKITDAQFEAGYRYYAHWYYSGIPGLSGGMNMVFVDKLPAGLETGLVGAAFKEYHSKWYGQSEKALGPRYSGIVNAVVLEEMKVAGAGQRFTRYNAKDSAFAAAVTKLEEGLERLIDCYSGNKS